MRRPATVALVFFTLVCVAGASRGTGQSPGPDLSFELRGGPAQPGSILEIAVTTIRDAEGVRATAFGQTATLVRDGSARRWRGLIGVDLATSESSSLVVTADLRGLPPAQTSSPLALKARQFPTRRLTVASRFVDPSQEELDRIRREAARLETIFGTVTIPDRLDTVAPPLPGVPGSNFGSRSVFNGEPRAPHAGADFRGATGTPIAAPAAGRVVLAEELFFTGQTVVIDHGVGLYSLLAHLSRIDVTPGQAVARGDIVGLLGATGRVTGPHLHWTVRLNGARVDPLRLVALLAPAQSGAAPGRGPKVPARSGSPPLRRSSNIDPEVPFAMPLFEYTCQACDHKFETLVRGGELPECPSCHGTHLEKKQSTFAGRISSGSPLTEIPTGAGCGHCGDPRGPGSCSMN